MATRHAGIELLPRAEGKAEHGRAGGERTSSSCLDASAITASSARKDIAGPFSIEGNVNQGFIGACVANA